MDTFILNFIEKNNLVKITSKDESLFLQGKIHQSFFMYLIIEIEEKYGIFFEDEELVIENFDTIQLIESMISSKLKKLHNCVK
ncbi:hypothetical protein [Ruminiclostridium josui]|uniref:hypothetical protein n=1 Tax=Ruminiclostridium josui TaxID=1499 RepID=UPI000463861A|nr:hypothetical protein [Ruminiclostridium josui]